MKATPTQALAVVDMVISLRNAVHQLGSVPSGHLYAQLMGLFSLMDYQFLIDTLVTAGAIRVSSDLISCTCGGH